MKAKLMCATMMLLVLVQGARAARMKPLSIRQLTDKAQLVLHGNVARKTVQRDAEGRIYTRIELAVIDAWKGRPAQAPFVAVQSGGVLGEEAAALDGEEELAVGEEVVLFLVLNPRGEGVVIGLSQGKFKVIADTNGTKSVHNIFHGAAPGSALANDKKPSGVLSLVELKTLVQGRRL